MTAHDWHTPERGHRFLIRVMVKLSLLLGRRTSRLILLGVAFYFLLFSAKARRASRLYLARVLQRPPGLRDLFRHFFTFASTVHDRIYFHAGKLGNFVMQVDMHESVYRCAASSTGSLFLGAHLGSFAAMDAIARRQLTTKLMLLMVEGPARNLQEILQDNVGKTISLIHPQAMLMVKEKMEDGYSIGMLADRMTGPGSSQMVDFLGTSAQFPIGPFRLAALLKAPTFFVTCLYLGSNRYRLVVEPFQIFSTDGSSESPAQRQSRIEQSLRAYVVKLESYCRQYPFNWFNFYDFWREYS